MNSIKGFTDVAYVGVAYGATMSILMTLFSIITVAAIPRIYRIYEAKIDVRPIISRFAGYFLLVALPLVTVMALYSTEIIKLLANVKFMHASILVPYFAFGTLFLCLTDYTTLQYHLANKTWITFIIKLLSGLSNVSLTLYLVPIIGLKGVGIAMLTSNVLFLLLSLIIRLPKLGFRLPLKQILCILLSGLPVCAVYYMFLKNLVPLSVGLQMSVLMVLFYLVYYGVNRLLKPNGV